MLKKEYMCPELSLMRLTLRDVIMASPEDISSHLNGDDTPSNPIVDPDEPIDW